MKYKDFLAIATAIVAAKRFERIDTDHVWREKEDGTIICRSDEVATVAGECVTIAKALAEELDLDWMDEGVKPNGMKVKDGEEFFEDDETLTVLDKIEYELHDLNDTMVHGEDSVMGSLIKIARNTGDLDSNSIAESLDNIRESLDGIAEDIENLKDEQ